MEDIVAIGVTVDTGSTRYFVTWGRAFDAVDPARTEELVLRYANGCSLGGQAMTAKICPSLRDARDETYFYEAVATYAAHLASRPTDPAGRARGAEDRAAAMEQGQEIYFLGLPRQ